MGSGDQADTGKEQPVLAAAPTSAREVPLSVEHCLRIENLALKRQAARSQLELLALEEKVLMEEVSRTYGIDPSWTIDLRRHVAVSLTSEGPHRDGR